MATPRTRSRTKPKPTEPVRVREDFVTTIEGVEIRLPSLTYLQTRLVRAMRGMSDRSAIWLVLEESATPEMMAAIDKTYPDDLDKLMDEWTEHSGITLGE